MNWIADVPLPPLPERDGRPLPIAPEEMWCANCGAIITTPSTSKGEKYRPCCRRPKPISPAAILAPDEYYIRQ